MHLCTYVAKPTKKPAYPNIWDLGPAPALLLPLQSQGHNRYRILTPIGATGTIMPLQAPNNSMTGPDRSHLLSFTGSSD